MNKTIKELTNKVVSKFSIFHFQFSIPSRGFTLIEVILVFAVLGIVSAASFASFSSYTKSQSVQSTASAFVGTLQTAKSKSLTQSKPAQCGAAPLRGYRVTVSIPSTYRLEVSCGNNFFTLDTRTLSSGVIFASGSAGQIFF
ncbi:prepilin-type N-terminal cleavage/methylation domain-containing protein, partial [Candidatus Microgenomates bacterium]|nr:prepilin-type N-terminal cleavage/methylation domain-containing protein [Candidatus Microgenomates bacterium]